MLRLLNPERDGPALHAIFGDEECCTYLAGPATRSVAETVSLLKKWNEGTEETEETEYQSVRAARQVRGDRDK